VALPVSADVGFRAGILVVAYRGVVVVDAAGTSVATVVGTDVSVVAVERVAADALAIQARVGYGARVAVGAWDGVVGIHAPSADVAGIIRTWVAVVAIDELGTYAYAAGAVVSGRALIGIVAFAFVRHILATRVRLARVIGARVVVVAGHLTGTDAFAQTAVVSIRAHVVVIAWIVVQRCCAADLGVAGVGRAHFPVVAIELAGG